MAHGALQIWETFGDEGVLPHKPWTMDVGVYEFGLPFKNNWASRYGPSHVNE